MTHNELTPRIPALRLVAATVLAALGLWGSAAPAAAAAYRYWGYYQWDGTAWAYAQAGPADTKPLDGAVEGWRFAVAETDPRPPRAAGDFEAICASTASAAGQKRVAVVIDYGAIADAEAATDDPPRPRGACARVDADASGAQVLSAVASVRVAEGLTCGLDGWPASGCGDEVTQRAPSGPEEAVTLALPGAESGSPQSAARDEQPGAAEQSGGAAPWGLFAAGAAAVAVAGAALVRLRRSEAAGDPDDARDSEPARHPDSP